MAHNEGMNSTITEMPGLAGIVLRNLAEAHRSLNGCQKHGIAVSQSDIDLIDGLVAKAAELGYEVTS